jgi:hypothetical protein
VFIVGYYQFSTNNKVAYADVATMRKYALAIVELFRGNDLVTGLPNCAFNSGVVYAAKVKIAPYEVNDRLIDRFLIQIRIKMIA